jgi:hypothetical protein
MSKRINAGVLKCVSCGSTRVRRSARQGLIERIFLPLRRLHPFHCIDCYKRFYSRSLPIRVESREPEIIPRTPKPAQDQRTEGTKSPGRFNQEERRCFSRLGCQIPAQVVAGQAYRVNGTVNAISLNGCFIETSQAATPGSEIEITLDIGEGTRVRGVVRRMLPSIGMGVEFTDMTVPNFRRLRSIARDSVRLHADL